MGTMATPMRRPGESRSSVTIALVIALVLHVVAVAAVPEFREAVAEVVGSTADFIDVAPEPPPPPPPAAEPPPQVERAAPRTPTEAAPPAPPQQTTTVPPPEVITALDNTNLGNWQVQQGTGPATQPIRSGVLSTTNTDGAANGVVDGGVPGGTGLVADADLSVRASAPPGLDALLERYYPADARQQAVEGRAMVAIEVRADGSTGRVRPLRESVPDFGFAQACVRTVREGGHWTPGRDRQGNAVASVLRFSCEFSVRR